MTDAKWTENISDYLIPDRNQKASSPPPVAVCQLTAICWPPLAIQMQSIQPLDGKLFYNRQQPERSDAGFSAAPETSSRSFQSHGRWKHMMTACTTMRDLQQPAGHGKSSAGRKVSVIGPIDCHLPPSKEPFPVLIIFPTYNGLLIWACSQISLCTKMTSIFKLQGKKAF